jgi:hypothetical protein
MSGLVLGDTDSNPIAPVEKPPFSEFDDSK